MFIQSLQNMTMIKIKSKIAICLVFSRFLRIHNEVFIVMFPRMQVGEPQGSKGVFAGKWKAGEDVLALSLSTG